MPVAALTDGLRAAAGPEPVSATLRDLPEPEKQRSISDIEQGPILGSTHEGDRAGGGSGGEQANEITIEARHLARLDLDYWYGRDLVEQALDTDRCHDPLTWSFSHRTPGYVAPEVQGPDTHQERSVESEADGGVRIAGRRADPDGRWLEEAGGGWSMGSTATLPPPYSSHE